MKRQKIYTPELREEAVKLVLTQALTLNDASHRLTIPKGTLANWVAAAKRGTSPKAAPGSRSVPELEAEVTKLRKELAEVYFGDRDRPFRRIVSTAQRAVLRP